MTRSKFSETQIIGVLKAVGAGGRWGRFAGSTRYPPRRISSGRRSTGGMEASDVRRMRELEEENRQLKRMYADLSLDHRILKDVLEKKPWERGNGGR
jgi:putative transposase